MKLSICAIGLNEAEHIEFWYKNHKDFADEMIYIDTGSYDGTQEIAKKLPIKYYEAKWLHSFADAKNFALRACTGDWILQLNPDLWIHPDNFQKIKDQMTDDIVAIAMPSKSSRDFAVYEASQEVLNDIPPEKIMQLTNCCLFRNYPDIYYRHRVHENANESIIENYGRDKIKIIKQVRNHHTSDKVYNNKEKVRYFWFLEDYGAIERKFWEHAQILRKNCYDNEL